MHAFSVGDNLQFKFEAYLKYLSAHLTAKMVEPKHPLFRLIFDGAFDEGEKWALGIWMGKECPSASAQSALEASVLNTWGAITQKIIQDPPGVLNFEAMLIVAARAGNIAAMRSAHQITENGPRKALVAAAEAGQIGAMQEAHTMTINLGHQTFLYAFVDRALRKAALGGHIAAMRKARDMGATDFIYTLAAAAGGGHIGAMREARDMGATDFGPALHYAALNGQMAAIKEAIAMGAEVDDLSLENAAEGGHIDALRELHALAISRGVILDFSRILSSAAVGGQVDAMREVVALCSIHRMRQSLEYPAPLSEISRAANQPVDPNPALVLAAEHGQIAAVKEALAMGATNIAKALSEASREALWGRTPSLTEVIAYLQARLT